ncbi:MAG: hypothetical protein ACFE9L_18090 [Candidatus Hodarchaeota archaeon]
MFVQFATVASEEMVLTVTFTGTDILNPENQVIYSTDEFFNEIKTESEQEYEKGEYIVNYNICLNFFGNIAATLNFFKIIGFLLFLTAEFIPLNKMMIEIQITRLSILAATAALVLIYVFFRYKPLPKTTTPGILKVFIDQTKERFKEIDESILKKADFLDQEDRILKEDSGEN